MVMYCNRQKKLWRHQKIICTTVLFVLFCFIQPPEVMAANGIEVTYRRAVSNLEALLKDSKKKKYRHNWLACIRQFSGVYRAQPDGHRADDALFMVARLYERLYKYSDNDEDRQEAFDYYNRLLKHFPKTTYRKAARAAIAAMQGKAENGKERLPTGRPVVKKGVVKKRPLARVKELPEEYTGPKKSSHKLSEVHNIRVWSNPSYTRIVVDLEDEVNFSYRLLKKDPSIGKPQRLYVDLNKTCMGPDVQAVVPIGDDLLSNARAAQYTPDTVRVVVDIKSIDTYNIFSLQNPFRVVLDVNGAPDSRRQDEARKAESVPVTPTGPVPKGAIATQLALGVTKVVIDPGHGGKDPGAIGYNRRILEKNVTLEIALRLAKKVRQRLGLDAVLTRDKDVFLSLEERTAIANTKNGDLFVSIHANANRNRKMGGIETYFLNLATDEEAILVAARENATSKKNISDLEAILNDLMKNTKVDESSRLAGYVQGAMAVELKRKYKKLADHGVKQAPFYVLLGASMPSILVEVSFISNPLECKLLNTAAYQEALADSIVVGIERYIQAIDPFSPIGKRTAKM